MRDRKRKRYLSFWIYPTGISRKLKVGDS